MKILFATDSFTPVVDGVVNTTIELANGLKKLGHQVYLAVPNDPKAVQNGHVLFKAYSIPFPSYKPYRFVIPIKYPLKKQAKNYKLDIIHIHSPFGLGGIAQTLARKRKIPCVYTFHTLFHDSIKNFSKLAYKFLDRPLTRYINFFSESTDSIIVPTEPVKKLLTEKYKVNNKIHVVPSGINPDKLKTIAKINFHQKYDIDPNLPIVLYAGRLVKEKNIPLLIQSFNILAQRRIPFHGLIVGEGVHHQVLQDLVNTYQLSQKVTFTGYIPQEELNLCYTKSAIFCTASKIETQCLAAIEAMAKGLPVLAVRVMGLQQTITDGINGILTEPNLDDFANALCRLLTDKELRLRLQEGATKLAKDMTIDASVLKHLDLYNELIKNHKGKPKKPLHLTILAKAFLGRSP